jgi:ClpX C4-type zinc finger
MTEEDQKDRDFVCSFCGKEAPEIQGMIASQTHSGIICDECLNLIAEIQWEGAVEAAAKEQGQDTSIAATRLMRPQIVTRYVSEDVHPATWPEFGVDWICDGWMAIAAEFECSTTAGTFLRNCDGELA